MQCEKVPHRRYIIQEAEAAEAEAAEARAAATGPAPPPTAILGFVPSDGPSNPAPVTGKYSWPAGFFQKRKQSHAATLQITASSTLHSQSSMQSQGSLQQDNASGDSHNAVQTSGSAGPNKETDAAAHKSKDDSSSAEEGTDKDHGAAWRDAAMAGQC